MSATSGDYSEGSGFQADFGYMDSITGSVYLGVELTYRNITYKDAGASLDHYNVVGAV